MRASGILMHVTSLPGPNGIGAMGKPAHRFVDFLEQAGQKYWQVLPLSPTGYGDSPYQSFSAFAGIAAAGFPSDGSSLLSASGAKLSAVSVVCGAAFSAGRYLRSAF